MESVIADSDLKQILSLKINNLYNQLIGSGNSRAAIVHSIESGPVVAPFYNGLGQVIPRYLSAQFKADYKTLILVATEIAEIILNKAEEEFAKDQKIKAQSLKIDFGFTIVQPDQVLIDPARAKSFVKDYAPSSLQELFGKAIKTVEDYTVNQNLLEKGEISKEYSKANSDIEYAVLNLFVASTNLHKDRNPSSAHSARLPIGNPIQGLKTVVARTVGAFRH